MCRPAGLVCRSMLARRVVPRCFARCSWCSGIVMIELPPLRVIAGPVWGQVEEDVGLRMSW
jgi:hypothetical protein